MEADFDSTLGATYVGVTTTACLYGISTLHVYTYWNRQKQDNAATRISIAVLWLADTTKLICATHIGYRLLITEYSNDPGALFYSTWSINLELLLTTLIVFVAQVSSVCHAWKSAKRINMPWATPRTIRLMGIVALFFTFVQLSFGVALSSLAWVYRDIREMDKHRWVGSVWLGSAAVCSITITYTLSALLVSTFVRVQSIIDLVNEFLRCFIHTGLLTSILTVVNVLAFSLMGQYIRIGVNFPLGTLNLITLLAILNTRPRELNSTTLEEYECDPAEHKTRSHSDLNQTSSQGSLRVRKLSFKMPPNLHGTGTAIKVFVQKETHVIGIPGMDVNYSDPMTQQRASDDPDGAESIDTTTDFVKPQTSSI